MLDFSWWQQRHMKWEGIHLVYRLMNFKCYCGKNSFYCLKSWKADVHKGLQKQKIGILLSIVLYTLTSSAPSLQTCIQNLQRLLGNTQTAERLIARQTKTNYFIVISLYVYLSVCLHMSVTESYTLKQRAYNTLVIKLHLPVCDELTLFVHSSRWYHH